MFPIEVMRLSAASSPATPTPDDTTNYTKALINSGSLIVANGAAAAWDETIREIGNIIDEGSGAQRYKLVYSGHAGAYAGNNVFVGYAYSADGTSWSKGGQLTLGAGRSSEDPYLLKVGSTYYLFVEDKETVPFTSIRLYTSTDFSTWTDQGDVLAPGTGWEAQDVSSPTVWVEGSTAYMLYEGRATDQEGAIGLATASVSDLETWTKSGSNPVVVSQNSTFSFAGPVKWATGIVPDDIIKTGLTYTLIGHGFDIEFLNFYPMIIESVDLTGGWADKTHGPVVCPTTDGTIMFNKALGGNNFHYVGSGGIRTATGVARGANVAKSTRVALNTTTGNQTITISGFGVPKAAIFTVGRAVTDNTAAAHAQGSVGACDTFRQFAAGFSSDDAAAAVNTRRSWSETDCIDIRSGGGTVVLEAHFVQFVEDGVVISIDTHPTAAAFLLHVTLIGGDADVYCDTTTGPTSGGTKTRTYYFETNALLAVGPGTTTNNASTSNGFGFASWDGSTLSQCGYAYRNIDAADPSNVQGGVRSDAILTALSGANVYISLDNFTSTSIRMNGVGADHSTGGVGLLAIGNVNAKAALLDTPTATGSKDFTGLGITPTAGFIIPTMIPTAATIEATGNGGAFGFSTFDASAGYCLSFADQDNAATTNAQSLSDNIAINLPNEAGAATFAATLTSFASGQATFNFSATNGTVRKWPSLFIG